MGPTCPHCHSALPGELPEASRCPACGKSVDARPLPGGVGKDTPVAGRIDRYEIRGLLGQGGMGRVFLAWDPRLEREVALKVLSPDGAGDERLLARFRREARLASALNHPHICTVHDMGESDGGLFIVMERVEGETLPTCRSARATLERVLEIGCQVASALAAAHAAGIVHRDIKPGNVMVRTDGLVKVVDFGLARSGSGALRPREGGQPSETEPGTLLGSLGYMSPEQACGREVDGASDVFSLGIVLYELATGAHPFQASSPAEVLQAVLSHTPPCADRVDPSVPEGLAQLLQRMLERDAALRPAAGEVEAALTELLLDGAVTSESGAPEAPRHSVGRGRELEELVRAFDEAAAGRSRILCLTGEPGIGKTTLMEDFLATLHRTGKACSVARGRCSERLAGTEAYLPVIEALEGLLRGPGGESAARTLRAVAPSWYAQVAPLAAEDSALRREIQQTGGLSQERLKRELGALLAALSRQRPLLLLLDDLHWADASTVDVLAYLGLRLEGLRVLLVVSYRPTDLQVSRHPFGPLKLDLQSRGLCHEVALEFLSRADVERYVELECPGNDFPPELSDLIHTRTEGSPLFMADVLRYLRDRGVIGRAGERWTLERPVSEVAAGLPESVRSMIQRKIEQLEDADVQLLLAASVQGNEFDSAIVAEALELDALQVEERLEELDRVRRFVREVEECELPDRTPTLRYRFVHVLYQNAMFASLRPARRVRLSQAVAEALVRHHGEAAGSIAAELALLFQNAREPERAARAYLAAARHAVRVFANREAATLAQHGLEQVGTLAPSAARDRLELELLLTLGPPLKDTFGWAAAEVTRVYLRASELGERVGGAPEFFPALWGMWMMYGATGDVATCRAMAERLTRVAEESGDRGHLLQAHHALTTTNYCAGEFVAALRSAELAWSLYDVSEHGEHAHLYGGHDPGSCCASFAALSLWALGRPDAALARSREGLRMVSELGHPVSRALSHWNLGVLHRMRREVAPACEQAELSRRIALDQGAPIFPELLLAWASSQQGGADEAVEQVRAALADTSKFPHWWLVYFRATLAEICAAAGRFEEALESIARAYDDIGQSELRYHLAELQRLEGLCHLGRRPARPEEGERALRRAIEQACRQDARMLELRALVDLGRHLAASGRGAEVRAELAERLAWFREGLELPDLCEARALLADLPAPGA